MCVCTLFIGHVEYVHKCLFATYILHWAMGIGSHCPCLHCALFMVAMCIVALVVGIVSTVEFCIVHCPLCNVGASMLALLNASTLECALIDICIFMWCIINELSLVQNLFGVGTANVKLQNTSLAMEAIDFDMYIDL